MVANTRAVNPAISMLTRSISFLNRVASCCRVEVKTSQSSCFDFADYLQLPGNTQMFLLRSKLFWCSQLYCSITPVLTRVRWCSAKFQLISSAESWMKQSTAEFSVQADKAQVTDLNIFSAAKLQFRKVSETQTWVLIAPSLMSSSLIVRSTSKKFPSVAMTLILLRSVSRRWERSNVHCTGKLMQASS